MASVSGSQIVFQSGSHQNVNLILNDGKTVTGSTVAGSLNIEVFTKALGSALPGVDGTAFIQDAVQVSKDAVQAGTLNATEQLGTGAFVVIDDTSKQSASQHQAPQGETLQLGTGAQTVIGSSGDTIIGGNSTSGQQMIDLTGKNGLVTAGPMTAVGGAGSLVVEAGVGDSIAGGSGSMAVFAGSGDTITGGSGPVTIFGGGPAGHVNRGDDEHDDDDKDERRGQGDNDQGARRNGHASQGRGNSDDQDGHSDRGKHLGRDEHQGRGGQDQNGAGGFGGNTITGGTGATTVLGGRNDLITGGSGALLINENPGASGGGDTIIGGSGALTVFEAGKGDSIRGGSGTNFIQGQGTGGDNFIMGGIGTVTGAGGLAVNTFIVSDPGDTIAGSKGSMSVDGGLGRATITAGFGGTTVNGGDRDVVNNLGTGKLLVDIASRDGSSTVRGGGDEMVNLASSHGATTLRDTSVSGGQGHLATTTVTGFSAPTDVIASSTSVDTSNKFIGSSSVSGGNTVLTFVDGAKITLVGVTDISKVMFVK